MQAFRDGYFDDMYSPEYEVNDMIKRYKGIIAEGEVVCGCAGISP